VTAQRSEKSPLGTTRDLVAHEIKMLYPTISLPVTVILFDLGKPWDLVDEAEIKPESEKTELPDNPVIDQDMEFENENLPEQETPQIPRKKPRARSKKAAIQDQPVQQAA
jgi:hypothetical protein